MEIGPLEMMVDGQVETQVVFQKQKDGRFHLGLSAALLSMLPLGLGGNLQKATTQRYDIERIETQMFLPTRKYVQRSVLEPEVLQYLARHRYRKSLYMIVGIKVPFDATIIHERKSKKGVKLSASIPGAIVGVPVDFGANVQKSSIDGHYERKSISSAFVFAYRLREVRYYKKDNTIKDTEFTKGAQLHALYGNSNFGGQPIIQDESYEGTEEEIDVDGIFGEDFEEDEHDTRRVGGYIVVSPP